MKHRRAYQPPTPVSPAASSPPTGVNPAAILARRAVMIEAGTHPVLAEQLASSAGENQAWRDRLSPVDARFTRPAAVVA